MCRKHRGICNTDACSNLSGNPQKRQMVEKGVVFVLGAPGAGKGTQCQKIVGHFDFVHISAGELLREERRKPNSQHGELIENCIMEGKIVPAAITCDLLEKVMFDSGRSKFLVDGFPRSVENRKGWDASLGQKIRLLFVLFFDCPIKICVQRCMARSAAGSKRQDDNMDVFEKRVNTYHTETQSVIDYYREKKLLKIVDSGRSEDEIFEDVKLLFQHDNFSV